jgi:hypothetical protein
MEFNSVTGRIAETTAVAAFMRLWTRAGFSHVKDVGIISVLLEQVLRTWIEFAHSTYWHMNTRFTGSFRTVLWLHTADSLSVCDRPEDLWLAGLHVITG